MTTDFTKHDIQEWLRNRPWTFHLVIEPADLRCASDDRALTALRRMNFLICKQLKLTGRHIRKKPLDERVHWMAFFQGTRDAANRHLHVLFHVPDGLRPSTDFESLKLKSAIQNAWLNARDKIGQPLIWVRAIKGGDDSRSVATYVSRYCSVTAWNAEVVHFSH